MSVPPTHTFSLTSSVIDSNDSIVIIGAGCVGMAVGVQLMQQGYQNVHIIAKSTTPETISDQAGALWRPFGEVSPENQRVFTRWGKDTFDFLNNLRLQYGSEKTGIVLMAGYEVFDTKQETPFWADSVIGFRHIGAEELKAAGIQNRKYGFHYTSLIVDMAFYMPWLHREYQRLGGKFHLRELSCISDVNTKFFPNAKLIFNCSGLGALTLSGDKTLKPVAGHILKMKCPSVHHFYMDSVTPTYIFPRRGDMVVGGTYWKDQWNTKPSIDTRLDIIRRAAEFVPDFELGNAELLAEYVGLRPYRDVTRLEVEYPAGHPRAGTLTLEDGVEPLNPKVTVPVIHNYGHGGSGITLHWGCGIDALVIAQQNGFKPTGQPPKIAAKL